MQNAIISLDFADKLKYFAHSLYVCAVTLFWQSIRTFWKTPSNEFCKTTNTSLTLRSFVSENEVHSFIKVQDVKFHFVEVGGKEKPLLILLHGFLDCWMGWRHQIPSLKEHFRVVAIDLKGYGDSEKPRRRHLYEVGVVVKELREIVSGLGRRQCVVVGHGMGAMLGWYFAALYPDVVTKFVAISCPHPNIHWPAIYSIQDKYFNARFIHTCQVPSLAKGEILRDNLAMIDKLNEHVTEKNERKQIIGAYKFAFSRAKDLNGPVNYLRTLPLARLQPGSVVTPTMMIVGSLDPFVTVESIVRSTQYLHHFQLKLVEGAAHAPHQQNPTQVNQFIKSFICESCATKNEDKTEPSRSSLIGNLMTNTFKYGNSLVDNVKKTTNGVVWRPHMLKS